MARKTKHEPEPEPDIVDTEEDIMDNEDPVKKLVVFLATGRTFTFKEVAITCQTESVLGFTYTSQSDGKEKEASFSMDHVAGISIERE